MSFNSLVVRKDDEGKTSAAVEEMTVDQLPEGNVTVSVEYSTVNYKDGLCIGSGVEVWFGTTLTYQELIWQVQLRYHKTRDTL